MNGVRVGHVGRGENLRNIQIGIGTGSRADADHFIGVSHVKRLAVSGGEDTHGLDAELAAGAYNPEGNFTPICYQYLLEHAMLLDYASIRKRT
jgi:hypothetical protein